MKRTRLKYSTTVPAKPPVAAEIPKKPSEGMTMFTTFVQNS